MKKINEVKQEQVEGVAEQVLAAMDQAMENFDNGKVSEPINEQLPTDEELAEQQERLKQDRHNQWKWQNAMLLYPAILTGICANPQISDYDTAQVSMSILKDALDKLYEFGQTL